MRCLRAVRNTQWPNLLILKHLRIERLAPAATRRLLTGSVLRAYLLAPWLAAIERSSESAKRALRFALWHLSEIEAHTKTRCRILAVAALDRNEHPGSGEQMVA